MPGRPSARALALLVVLLVGAGPEDPVSQARALLARNEPAAAVRRLEDALPEADKAALPALLDALREAYARAIERATAEGKADDAERFQEGLALLGPAETRPAARPAPEMPKIEPGPAPTDPTTGPQPEPEPAAPLPLDPSPAAPKPAEPAPRPAEPAPRPAPPADELGTKLLAGDRAWKEKRYLDAGAAYAALAEADRLPPARRDHWAYCRLVAVLERINAHPRNPAEWAEIHAEIDHIRLLAPKNWYSVYLRNVVVERSGGVKPADPSKVVLRGAAPDEAVPPKAPALPPPARRAPQTKPASRPSRPVPAPAPAPATEPAPAPAVLAPAAEVEIGRVGPPVGRWQTYVTPNFRILHDDEALARKVAAKAENARREAARRWTGAEPRGPWTPTCDLYLYPTAAIFAAETQQSPESPGFSTAGLSGGRVTARLVKLRADYPKMLDAVLPHEVTHVVLADLFPTAQIPRWADEGMAVLSEPAEEQALRVRDLAEPLSRDVLFGMDVLMTADYPGGSHWALYYAQSVSVTRYLAGLGTPQQFVQFVRMAQAQGPDAALRKAYRIEGLADLETRWKAHARAEANPAVASSASDASPPADATRR